MKGFKNLLRQLHLILGLASGLVVFVVCCTGVLVSFDEEVRNLVHHDLVHSSETVPALPVSELITGFRSEVPKPAIKAIRIRKGDYNIEIILKNKESWFISPSTGKVLGHFNKDNDFQGTMLRLHRSLLLNDAGKVVTATSVCIFLLMIISGIILWWPKGKSMRRQKLRISWASPRFRRFYDLHSVLGFYASWILIFTVLTGMIWACHWAEDLMYKATGSAKEERRMLHSKPSDAKTIAVEQVLAASSSVEKDWQECYIAMPEDSAGVYRLNFKRRSTGFFQRQDQLFFDQYSGKPLKAQFAENASTGDKIKSSNLSIHTGRILGLPGRLLVLFATLIGASLPVTGFVMWRMKRKMKK